MSEPDPLPERLVTRHLALGYAGLFVFGCLGLALETLLAFKASPYLDAGNETRRLVWRLAHAHGTGLSVVHLAYGLTVRALPRTADAVASACLVVALALIPLGFFGGGLDARGGDPGLLVLAVPPGAVAALSAFARIARRAFR